MKATRPPPCEQDARSRGRLSPLRCESVLQQRKLLKGLEAPESPGGLLHGGGWGGGWRAGGWGWGPAVVSGLAAGAIVGSLASPYNYGNYGCGACTVPLYDQWGNYIGNQLVNAC
jgi:hypothetical protein